MLILGGWVFLTSEVPLYLAEFEAFLLGECVNQVALHLPAYAGLQPSGIRLDLCSVG
jgi:hypothetical protein